MSKQTEKVLKELNKFINESSDPSGKDENNMNDLINSFMAQYQPSNRELTDDTAESSDDFLELAESATSKKSALKYAKKAVELDPDNLDALVMVAELSASSMESLIEKYEGLIETAENKLKAKGYFGDDCIGDFWGLFETRPYMRLLDSYSNALVECGRLRMAIAGYNKMLTLCKNDNLGARYRLLHLLVFFEDELSALDLVKKFPKEEGTQFLLPLSILYFKLGNLREADRYLKKLCEINKDTVQFFNGVVSGGFEEALDGMEPNAYRPGTIEEFLVESEENSILFINSVMYFEWAYRKLKAKRKSR